MQSLLSSYNNLISLTLKRSLWALVGILLLMACKGNIQKSAIPQGAVQDTVVRGDTVAQWGDNIMVIFQDRQHVYWMGSWESGLYRWDGKSIVQFTTKQGLPSNRVDEIKEDKEGNLLIVSRHPDSRVARFDGRVFTVLTPQKSEDWKLQPDDIWLKGPNWGQVFRFDGKVLHELTVPNPPNLPRPFEIYSIYKDNKGNIWLGTNPLGVCRYNGKTFDWIVEEDVTELHGGPANGVRSMTQDTMGAFWFNTRYKYFVNDNVQAPHKTFYSRQKTGLENAEEAKKGDVSEFLSILSDKKGSLWMATYQDGAWKYDGAYLQHFPIQENGKDIHLFCVFEDDKGDIWLGTPENGVWKYNGRSFERLKF